MANSQRYKKRDKADVSIISPASDEGLTLGSLEGVRQARPFTGEAESLWPFQSLTDSTGLIMSFLSERTGSVVMGSQVSESRMTIQLSCSTDYKPERR